MSNVMDMFSLEGKTAVITGGERGIGRELAVGFAKAGANIVIAGLLEDEFPVVTAMVEEQGKKCVCIHTDVAKEEDVKNMVQQVLQIFPTIDVLVNNAGTNRLCPAEEFPLDEWERVMGVNLTGVFLCSREVGAVMLKQHKGSIINISSMSALIVNPLPSKQIAYNVSKAGVAMLTKCMAVEWAEEGIRVNAIAPGFMKTPLIQKRLDTPNDPGLKKWLASTPMNRIGHPSELVGLALYYASEASTFTTGAVMPVDGGYTLL